ncbi:unnamed protein product, partial [Symbiodinium microadriaticum]
EMDQESSVRNRKKVPGEFVSGFIRTSSASADALLLQGTRIMSAAVKEIKEVMERQNGNIALLSEDIDMLKKMILELTRTANETVADLATEVRNLQNRWDEFIAEEEEAREEYAMYFQEQEELKNHLLERDRRLNRRLEQELRHEDHLGARTSASSTSPTRTEIHEFSDREYFDLRTREEEEQELFEENPDEYYSQSYPGAEEAGEAWTGEEEEGPWTEEEEGPKEEEKPKEKRKETQAEYDATRKELLAKARANEALKQKKRKQQEKGFKTPVDKGHEHKYYTEDGSIWKQNYKTGEKTWYNWDYKYKHEKGFMPKDEEDAAYWERMGKQEEETRRKSPEDKAAKEEEERQKQKAREKLERAAEEAAQEAVETAEEKQKKEKEGSSRSRSREKQKEKEVNQAMAEAFDQVTGSKEKDRIKELEKQLAELKAEVRSETGSTKGEDKAKEKKKENKEKASSSTDDPETTVKGPVNADGFVRGAPKFEEETDRNFYVVYPFDGNDYQWKWNSVNMSWHFFDLQERRWYKQKGRDSKGKDACLAQERKHVKGKGKKGKGKTKEEETSATIRQANRTQDA